MKNFSKNSQNSAPRASNFFSKMSEFFSATPQKISDFSQNFSTKSSQFFADRSLTNTIFLRTLAAILLARATRIFFQNIQSLRDTPAQRDQLQLLASYDQQISPQILTISDLESQIAARQRDADSRSQARSRATAAYDNFLISSLLPSLNIRRDPRSGTIDATLFGRRFLAANPLNEVSLARERSQFFSSVTDGVQSVQVQDLRLGEPTISEDRYSIPVSVSLLAPSRRLFLQLVEKISLTSHPSNLILLNEFFFALRSQLTPPTPENSSENSPQNSDQKIGTQFDARLADPRSDFITDEILNSTIAQLTSCQTPLTARCIFAFREKFRTIPTLAYPLSDPNTTAKPAALRDFLRTLPPIITLENFSFSRSPHPIFGDESYEIQIRFELRGRAMSPAEFQEISQFLSQRCFGPDAPDFTPSSARDQLQKILRSLDPRDQSNAATIQQITEILATLDELHGKFSRQNLFEQTRRLRESYRVLDDAGYCRG